MDNSLPAFPKPGHMPAMSSLIWLQGSQNDLTKEFHLSLLFQPNCPGCHMHAIPAVNELNERISEGAHPFDVYCISTAFEDFNYNTVDSARALLLGKLVGVSKRRLGATTEDVPLVPMAHDIAVDKSTAPDDWVLRSVETTKETVRQQLGQGLHPPGVVNRALANVGPHLLPARLACVFYAARAMGTPTWVVHADDGRILGSRFGQESVQSLETWVDGLIQGEKGHSTSTFS